MNITLVQTKGVPAPIDSVVNTTLTLQKTHPAHFSSSSTETQNVDTDSISSGFRDMVLHNLDKVSEVENYAVQIAQEAQFNPSIDEHDVSIAAAKAGLAIQLTRSIIDRALEAYRSIISLR